jgi:hypothetical protein
MSLVMLSTLERQEILVDRRNLVLRLRQHSTESLTELIWLVGELHLAIDQLQRLSSWESRLLKESEEQLLFGPGGAFAKIQELTQIVILTGLRQHQTEPSPRLRLALRGLGERLGNPKLSEL